MKPTLDSIDQWLFDALEGNLNPAQEQALEDFLAQHPDLEFDQDAWIKTKYAAPELTFEPKAALYRKKEFGVKHFAAAAILLLIVSIGYYSISLYREPSRTAKKTNTIPGKSAKATSSQLSSSSNSSNYTNSILGPSKTFDGIKPSTDLFTPDIQSATPSLLLNSEEALRHEFYKALTSIDSKTVGVDLYPLQTLEATLLTGYRTNLNFESLAGVETKFEANNHLHWPALQRISQFAQKELGLSNNQSYDLLIPGKSNIDANISSVGTQSQTRFQSTSIARANNSSEQSILGQQFSLDGYARGMRSGFGLQGSYKQYAGAAITDYEIGIIASPKIALNRMIVLEPAARLRLGARYATVDKLQQLSFIEFENSDMRNVQIDSTQAMGRRLFYKDLDFGLAIQTPILFANFQLDNAFKHFDYAMGNEQNPNKSRASQLLTMTIGTQYATRNERMRFAPYIQYRRNDTQTQYLAGLQLNFQKWQFGLNIADNNQYQAAIGYLGKHSAVIIQSCQQQLLTLNQPSYYHQVTFRIYSQTSRKARRYIDLL